MVDIYNTNVAPHYAKERSNIQCYQQVRRNRAIEYSNKGSHC